MDQPSRDASRQASLSDRLHQLSSAALDYLRARLDLLQHEWREERSHVLGLLWRWALFALATLTLYQLTAAFIVLALWNTPWRLQALGGVMFVTAGIAAWAWRSVQSTLARSEAPFASTLAEFDKDRELLRQLGRDRDATPAPGDHLDEPPASSTTPAQSGPSHGRSRDGDRSLH